MIRIGLMPTRRPIFNIEFAQKTYGKVIPFICQQMEGRAEVVGIDDVCKGGMAAFIDDIDVIVRRFRNADIDAIVIPFCDFGCEEVVVGVAKHFQLPVLIWGPRDIVSTFELRGGDTQCGLFAATKVLRNYGVKFSYIWNCEMESPDFAKGLTTFIQTCYILKALRDLNVAEIGDRPKEFYSVIHNQLALIRNYNISVKPIPLKEVSERTKAIIRRALPKMRRPR